MMNVFMMDAKVVLGERTEGRSLMRCAGVGVWVVLMILPVSVVRAEDKRRAGEQVLGGVISGLLGGPSQESDVAYLQQERERLLSFLQQGEYATSRQGEPIDVMILGIPLTRTEHVYTARPIPPSQTSYR